jgi:hypothetical protein
VEVGAVYDIEPAPRIPQDVLAATTAKGLVPAKAKHKWLTRVPVMDAAIAGAARFCDGVVVVVIGR